MKHAKIKVIEWLRNHSSYPSILIGDFNLSTAKLFEWINYLGDWEIFPLNGSSISWISGNRSSDINHAIVNSKMKELLSSGSFIDYYSISDHKPLLN
jgi:hypothetical protein